MNLLKLKLVALFLTSISFLGLHAQEAVLSTGNTATGSGGSASYSVGQVVYTTNSGSNGSVNQGVQQAFIITEVETNLEQEKDINLNLSVYPNPTTNYLTLKIEDDNIELSQYSAMLFDIGGKLLHTQQINNSESKIDMSNLPPSCYYLKVVQQEKNFKTFKIIKTQ